METETVSDVLEGMTLLAEMMVEYGETVEEFCLRVAENINTMAEQRI